MYCTDLDLVRWEPRIAIEGAVAAQAVLTCRAIVSGRTLRIVDGTFANTGVRRGQLVAYDDGNGGQACAAIAALSTPTTLELDVAATADPHRAVTVAVRSFAAQRRIVSDVMLRRIGIDPGHGLPVNVARRLRRPCVLGALQMIYANIAASAHADEADVAVRLDFYGRLYRRALATFAIGGPLDDDATAAAYELN